MEKNMEGEGAAVMLMRREDVVPVFDFLNSAKKFGIVQINTGGNGIVFQSHELMGEAKDLLASSGIGTK